MRVPRSSFLPSAIALLCALQFNRCIIKENFKEYTKQLKVIKVYLIYFIKKETKELLSFYCAKYRNVQLIDLIEIKVSITQ